MTDESEISRDEVQAKVFDIIRENLNVEDVKTELKFVDDLKADSLDIVEAIMAFEEEFGIEIPDQDASKIVTVEDAIIYILNAVNNINK